VSLRFRVGEAIRSHALWAPGDAVAVAVSGGADSVALLDLLVATAGWHRAALSVVTVDHGLREGSASDADYVQSLALGYGLRCHRERVTPDGPSEAALRDARHAVFDALPAQWIATGHHRGDQAETVLLRLIRGTSTAGLAGLRWRSGRRVRPLLDTDPAELRAYLGERRIAWRVDPTNAELGPDRNKIRHQVLPLLQAMRPGCDRAIARTAARLAEESSYLEAAATAEDPGDHWASSWIASAPVALLRILVLRRDPTLDAAGVDRVIAAIEAGRPLVVGAWELHPGPGGGSWVRR
jgi:tRNA(Ile)-lysidine synthase